MTHGRPLTPPERSVLLSVAYDGTGYAGWAPQREQRTIAGELQGALRVIDPRIGALRGSSRTDAGVHARDQRVAFDPSFEYPLSAWLQGAQKHLPASISIRRACYVERGFDPRGYKGSKTYRYLLLADERRDPFFDGRVFRVPELAAPGALERARAELAAAVGTHDFAAFRSSADARENTVRTLYAAELGVDAEDPRLLRLDVRGSGFMHNMVRILVGTVVDVARRRLAPGAIERGLASRDRRSLGITAPPEGLYLERTELAGDELRWADAE